MHPRSRHCGRHDEHTESLTAPIAGLYAIQLVQTFPMKKTGFETWVSTTVRYQSDIDEQTDSAPAMRHIIQV